MREPVLLAAVLLSCGLLTRNVACQGGIAQRSPFPFLPLSDEHLKLTRTLNLPTSEVGSVVSLKRSAPVINDGSRPFSARNH